MPLFFAAVAHSELAFGNISFEFYRNAKQVEKITAIENDTLEKVFTTPEKYQLVYVNVSSNQKALTNGLSKLFDVELTPADPQLERVKKVGVAIGEWWRRLPVHAHLTEEVSDEASTLREYIFKPLAELEPDIQRIILKDFFEHVFDDAKKVTSKQVEEGIKPFKIEMEGLLGNLKKRIIAEYAIVFGEAANPGQGLTTWFTGLSEKKQTYVYHAEMASLVDACRGRSKIDDETLLKTSEKLTGLPVSSWGDDQVVKFGAKLESVRNFIDSFEPPKPLTLGENGEAGTDNQPPPGQGYLSVFLNGKKEVRTFEILDTLSPNGDVLENMLNSTLEQLGKGLDEKEKVAIIYRVVGKHVFGA